MQTAGRYRFKGSISFVWVDNPCNVCAPICIFKSRPQLMDDSVRPQTNDVRTLRIDCIESESRRIVYGT